MKSLLLLMLGAFLLAGCQAPQSTATLPQSSPVPRTAFRTGVDANYALQREDEGAPPAAVVFQRLADAGATHFRVRLWTTDNGPSGLHYATVTAKQAQAAGMKPYVVIFLSDDWSDLVKQPAPEAWRILSPADKLKAIETYTALVARHFRDAGVDVDFYEIGNEIDFGLCGVFEEQWAKRVSVDYLRQNIWPEMVPMLAAAQAGVRQVQPDAKFTLHLAQWDWPEHCTAFSRFMMERGVAVDYAGLSYFPTSVGPDRSGLGVFMDRVNTLSAAIRRPVVVCEYAYPALPQFEGQFADWNKPVDRYPLSDDGQKRWIADFLAAARANPNLAGAYYWSPEWYDSPLWHAFSLFDRAGRARPALESLGR